jgi:putative salt-induced outer membrane protein YdiY
MLLPRPFLAVPMAVLLLAGAVRAQTNAPDTAFETTASLDALLTRGNTTKGEIGTKVETKGSTPYFEKVRAGAAYAYGQSEADSIKTTTAKRWELFGNARRPWNPGKTYTFTDAKIQSDAVGEVHYRLNEGGGLGVYLQKSDTGQWSTEGGVSWVFEETDDGSDNYAALRLAERYEQKWEGGAVIAQDLEWLSHAFKLYDFLLNADVELTTVITQTLNLRTALEYRYRSRPPEEAKSYDLRLVMGVSCKF